MENINGNKIIWKTDNFVAVASERPLVSREEGGHIKIHALGDKYRFDSSLDFTPRIIVRRKKTLSNDLRKLCKSNEKMWY